MTSSLSVLSLRGHTSGAARSLCYMPEVLRAPPVTFLALFLVSWLHTAHPGLQLILSGVWGCGLRPCPSLQVGTQVPQLHWLEGWRVLRCTASVPPSETGSVCAGPPLGPCCLPQGPARLGSHQSRAIWVGVVQLFAFDVTLASWGLLFLPMM